MFKSHIISIVKDFFFKNKKEIIIIINCSMISYLIDAIIIPNIISKILIKINDKEEIKPYIIKLIYSYILSQYLYITYEKKYTLIEPLFTQYITNKIIDNVFIKYESNHENINSSIIFNKITNIRQNLIWIINKVLFNIIPRFISLFVVVGKFYIINNKIGLITIYFAILQVYLVLNNINECINKTFHEFRTRDNIMDIIEDKFNNLTIINNTYKGLEYEINICKSLSKTNKLASYDAALCVNKNQQLGFTCNSIYSIYIIYYSYILYKKDIISNEQLINIIITMHQLIYQINDICYFLPEIMNSFGILKNNEEFMIKLFDYTPNDSEYDNITFNKITLDNITFSYNNNNILTNFSKVLEKNKLIIIHGKSGSGKTTLVKLICNILKPDTGNIYINDYININTISKNCIKQNIYFITQDTNNVFNDTILYNLTYGIEINDTLIDKIKHIFIKYNLINVFLNKNKDKNNIFDFFNFKTGKFGDLLSGGQKQIIHIIRSLIYNNSSVLIFDEPTSALDIETRNNILNLIKHNLHDKIVIIITHDSYINNLADDIINIK
jgi:ABC-type bacteriocin/lantibiotic exporter with double-glycine peptidase domain